MAGVTPLSFPQRLPLARLTQAYDSVEQAFACHDYMYVARFAEDPGLRGCALLMLGNRIGGEKLLDRANSRDARSFLLRAFAAWQDDDGNSARRWLQEGRRLDPHDTKSQRLAALIEQPSFRMLFHWDILNRRYLDIFRALPGIEMLVTSHLKSDSCANLLPPGQPIATQLPPGTALDLVLTDDLKMAPVGIGDLGAPVVAIIHDHEWYYECLDRILPDIDLLTLAASSEMIELAQPFHTHGATYFFPLHMAVPDIGMEQAFADTSPRPTDLFYSGSVEHDFYRYKKQAVLSLGALDPRYTVTVEEKFYPIDELWQQMRQSRFSLMAARHANYGSTRALESLGCGTVQLIEEEDANPFFYSAPFDGFAPYRRSHQREDIERHLAGYEARIARCRAQIGGFAAEFNQIFPRDPAVRALRYLRHALFMTRVMGTLRTKKFTPPRTMVYMDEPNRLAKFPPKIAEQFVAQTTAAHGLRRAYAARAWTLAMEKSETEAWRAMQDVVIASLEKYPDSLALYHALGLCQRGLGLTDQAIASFTRSTDKDMRLYPEDPPPVEVSKLDSCYWINDARTREGSDKTEPLAPLDHIWRSFAFTHLADIAWQRGDYAVAKAQAQNALDLFAYHHAAQRLYLRASFALIKNGDADTAENFLQSFRAACFNDYSVLHDFAVPAYHLLMMLNRPDQAEKLRAERELYRQRIHVLPQHVANYPEYRTLARQYDLDRE